MMKQLLTCDNKSNLYLTLRHVLIYLSITKSNFQCKQDPNPEYIKRGDVSTSVDTYSGLQSPFYRVITRSKSGSMFPITFLLSTTFDFLIFKRDLLSKTLMLAHL